MSLTKIEACVVIPASGSGERYNMHPPKQFECLGQKPIISHTISAFERIDCITHIVVTTPQDDDLQLMMESIVKKFHHIKVHLTKGANSRHRSIFEGLKCLKCILKSENIARDPVVIIHDGVRPFVDKNTIMDVIQNTKIYKAIGIVRPLVSTVISVDKDDFLKESLDRSLYWASEMPQGYMFSLIYEAYLKCSDEELNHGTECLKIASDYSAFKPKILKGGDNLWKITYQRDMAVAREFVSSHHLRVYIDENDKTHCCIQDLVSSENLNVLLFAKEELSASNLKSDNCLLFYSSLSLQSFESNLSFLIKSIENYTEDPNNWSDKYGSSNIVAIFCAQTTEMSSLNEVHTMLHRHSHKLLSHNVHLYCIIATQSTLSEPTLRCLNKILGDHEGTFAGQVFLF
uniref:2-C-methyl-D-erythritol 4-phosphate cytidylyltransferase, chloroplastic n=1 Tax=Ciona intestinalis TaxID=7719 RepID=F6U3K8_CIOIN|nr:D-ribitol-5-phosphate cytidylyltransferase-like isoform X2 [Ciona intestinalis]|eukprot:XP_002125703.2 D-ribitol-5-phosphate cytidylyltransferase-like isoform X2 [Ciona intestinalis]